MIKPINQRGAVAIISVIIFSVILTVIVTAFAAVTAAQQRRSLAYDLENRAFFTAQTGFEDTKREITLKRQTTSKTTCPPVVDSSVTPDLGPQGSELSYTCQIINLKPSVLSADFIGEQEAYLFPLRSDTAITGTFVVRIKWESGTDPRSTSEKSLPTQEVWRSSGTSGTPAMMRSQFIWTPVSTITRANIKSQAYFLNPTTNTNDETWPTTNANRPIVALTGDGELIPQEPIKNISCTTGTIDQPSACTGYIYLTGVNSNSYSMYLVLRPIYESAKNVTVELLNSAATSNVLFSSGQAEIDITARAGSYYRRFKQSYPYGAVQVTKLPAGEFALLSGDGICKQININNTLASYSRGCEP